MKNLFTVSVPVKFKFMVAPEAAMVRVEPSLPELAEFIWSVPAFTVVLPL